MPMYDLLNGATSYNELASASDYNGTSYNALATGYEFNGTSYFLLFGDGTNMVHTSELISGATNKAGTPGIIITDSSDTHNTGVSADGWYLAGNGRICAALYYKVLFSGFTKINFTITANSVYVGNGGYVSVGYRTDTKTWINASGVGVTTKQVLTTAGQTGTFSIPITGGAAGGFIIFEIMNHGTGISSSNGATINRLWLS